MNLKKIFLKKNSTVKEAIKSLNESACQIILVVDDKQKLIGTVTDGDIRRCIAKGNDLNCKLKKIMNKNPVTVKGNANFQNIQRIMKMNSILKIPEISKNNKIIKLHSWDVKASKIKKNIFFILAGGRGKRLWPLTKNNPKPMLKISNKPILHNLISDAKNFGFNNFVISVNYKKNKIINYFKNGSKLNVKISYIIEKNPLGTAGSLKLLKKNKLPIIVTNGDISSNVNFSELLDFHNQNKAFATVVVKQIEKTNSYGVIKTNGIIFKNFVEKPSEKININTGIYVFDPKTINYLPYKKIDMPEVLLKLKKQNKKIIIYPIHENWYDLGLKKDLLAAQKKNKK